MKSAPSQSDNVGNVVSASLVWKELGVDTPRAVCLEYIKSAHFTENFAATFGTKKYYSPSNLQAALEALRSFDPTTLPSPTALFDKVMEKLEGHRWSRDMFQSMEQFEGEGFRSTDLSST